MPRFNNMVAILDERIAKSEQSNISDANVGVQFSTSKFKMKAFFPSKAAPYYLSDTFTIAVRKECIEYYRKLRKGHALANVEVFDNMVRISVVCGGFIDELFGKVVREGIGVKENPKLSELLDSNCRYGLMNDKSGATPVSSIFLEIDRGFHDWPEAFADPEIIKEIRDLINFCLDLYNELVKSPSSSIKALAKHFYD